MTIAQRCWRWLVWVLQIQYHHLVRGKYNENTCDRHVKRVTLNVKLISFTDRNRVGIITVRYSRHAIFLTSQQYWNFEKTIRNGLAFSKKLGRYTLKKKTKLVLDKSRRVIVYHYD